MTLTLPDYLHTNIIIAGDVMIDKYWHGTASRISPEAPVPVVKINHKKNLPGAAANVALNIASLGASASLISLTGQDRLAEKLEKMLLLKNIKTFFHKIKNFPTISKLRILSQHQQLIRLDIEKEYPQIYTPEIVLIYQKIINNFNNKNINNIKNNLIILSDYGKGVLKCAQDLIQIAHQNNIPVLVDPKGNDYTPYKHADLLTPNRQEFEAVAGKYHTEQDLTEKALNLIQHLNLKALLVTRGAEGMSLIQPDLPPFHLPAKKQEIFDVTGAGDTVISVLGASFAAGKSLEQSVVLANLAAGIVVKKLGASTVSPHELRRALSEDINHIPAHQHKKNIFTEDQLQQFIQDAHAHGETVVMTNGCFDILHPGHIAYLEEAKQLGDHLIIAVNSDDSVRKLKGLNRPVNSLEHRLKVLAGLGCVDGLVAFEEETPERLINKLLPDILVKGGDYQPHQIAGSKAVIQNGGKIKILSFIDGYSTSDIINYINNNNL